MRAQATPEGELAGARVLVTGATSGIGLATARHFARRGAAVIGVGRDVERSSRARALVDAAALAGGAPEPRFELADLSLMSSVADLAGRLAEQPGGLDIVAHVAGYYSDRRRLSAEGIELQWAVNHLAPFALTLRLLPLLEGRRRPKILVVSSESHYFGRIRWSDTSRRWAYVGILAYAQSKLANVLFVRELHRRYGERIDSFAVDPGLVDTEVGGKHASGLTRLFWSMRSAAGDPPELPASLIVHLAAAAELDGRGGRYWRDRAERQPSARALEE
ncbi:MAG TPA: SDR family NAD(P)-dependent oxidoreductase, partial [Rectinemataceae bacterium]|nr:SDR family NAD(P)-dependent oxidoreductase [Rectinemataceae bacterium]